MSVWLCVGSCVGPIVPCNLQAEARTSGAGNKGRAATARGGWGEQLWLGHIVGTRLPVRMARRGDAAQGAHQVWGMQVYMAEPAVGQRYASGGGTPRRVGWVRVAVEWSRIGAGAARRWRESRAAPCGIVALSRPRERRHSIEAAVRARVLGEGEQAVRRDDLLAVRRRGQHVRHRLCHRLRRDHHALRRERTRARLVAKSTAC